MFVLFIEDKLVKRALEKSGFDLIFLKSQESRVKVEAEIILNIS